jgi:hypothetical protein
MGARSRRSPQVCNRGFEATKIYTMKCALFNTLFCVSSLLIVLDVAMWVRSYRIGDYVRLGPNFYLSFARGDCRIVHADWFFVGNYPVVGSPWVMYPLDKVGDYPMGSGASYLPLWLVAAILLTSALWSWRMARKEAAESVWFFVFERNGRRYADFLAKYRGMQKAHESSFRAGALRIGGHRDGTGVVFGPFNSHQRCLDFCGRR